MHHENWMTKKNLFKNAIYQVLQARFEAGQLHESHYSLLPEEEQAQGPNRSEEPLATSTTVPPDTRLETERWLDGETTMAASSTALDESLGSVAMPPKAESSTGVNEKEKSLEEAELEAQRWNEQVQCVDKLEQITWMKHLPSDPSMLAASQWIFQNGMKFCTQFQNGCLQLWHFPDFPGLLRAWTTEMEVCLDHMSRRAFLPKWLLEPHDRNIRMDASQAADGFIDPGNLILDVFVHIFRLWRFPLDRYKQQVLRQPIAEYGASANKSAKGPVNLRGNIVEAISRNLQSMGSGFGAGEGSYDAVDWWITKGNTYSPSQIRKGKGKQKGMDTTAWKSSSSSGTWWQSDRGW